MAFFRPSLHAVSLVRTTVAKRPEAERLARRLIEARLAACVHVSEVASVYRWEGAVQQETEFLVEARTTVARRDEVAKAMQEGHPYATPLVEVVAAGLPPGSYLDWVRRDVR